jgi:hypothetical protein
MLNWQANALVHLSEVAVLSGKDVEAQRHLQRALALYEEKGNIVAVARVRDRLEQLRTEVPALEGSEGTGIGSIGADDWGERESTP